MRGYHRWQLAAERIGVTYSELTARRRLALLPPQLGHLTSALTQRGPRRRTLLLPTVSSSLHRPSRALSSAACSTAAGVVSRHACQLRSHTNQHIHPEWQRSAFLIDTQLACVSGFARRRPTRYVIFRSKGSRTCRSRQS